MQTPWAILLCKFKDDPAPDPVWPKSRYEELFTSAGSGKSNLVDYFRDMSSGRVDLSGSQVFGPLTIDKNRADYKGRDSRNDLLQWARDAAIADKVKVGDFFSVAVIMLNPTDMFGGPNGCCLDDGRDPGNGMSSLSPSFAGQEMGHVYGLDHSRADGSAADYMDNWDVMSTASNCWMFPHPDFNELDKRANPIFLAGPGLNAPNMWSMGWLVMTRVWNADSEHFGTTVQLRPLHHPELPGYLAARIGTLFFEFRVKSGWDRAIPEAVVLVHDFNDGHSYIYRDNAGNQGFTAGSVLEVGDPSDPLGSYLKVTVSAIDSANQIATLNVVRKRDRHPKIGIQIALEAFGSDAGGFYVIGGKLKKVPPWSPLYAMIEHIDQIQDSGSITARGGRRLVQADAFERIAQLAGEQLTRLQSFRSPAPPEISQKARSGGSPRKARKPKRK
jgi:hypothetical protein